MKEFLKYLVVWISQNLSIPFWMVGHIHLSINVYEDIYEIIASLGMNIIVAIGFFIDYKNSREMAYKKKGASKIVKNYKAQKQKEKEDKEASQKEVKT